MVPVEKIGGINKGKRYRILVCIWKRKRDVEREREVRSKSKTRKGEEKRRRAFARGRNEAKTPSYEGHGVVFILINLPHRKRP